MRKTYLPRHRKITAPAALQPLEPRMLLSGVGDNGGDSIPNASKLGFITEAAGRTVLAAVGAGDSVDVFKVQFDRPGEVLIEFDYTFGAGASENLTFSVVRNIDRDGDVDPGETMTTVTRTPPASHLGGPIELPVGAGDYYLIVHSDNPNADSYTLSLQTIRFEDTGGWKISRATDLGFPSHAGPGLPDYGVETILERGAQDWYKLSVGRDLDITASVDSFFA